MTPFFLNQVGMIAIVFLFFIVSLLISIFIFKKAVESRKSNLTSVEGYNIVRYKYYFTPQTLSKLVCVSVLLFVGLILAQFEGIAENYLYLLLVVAFVLQFTGIQNRVKKSGVIAMTLLFILGGAMLYGHYQFIGELNSEFGLRIIFFISECCYVLLFIFVYLMIVQLMWKPQKQMK